MPSWLSTIDYPSLLRAAAIFGFGLLAVRLLRTPLQSLSRRFAPADYAVLLQRAAYYALLALVLATGLSELGFDLTVLIGAAGVFSVAIGFASQTSASNLISGLFLVIEKPFAIGETIRVADVTGEVLSVDMLSVKLRTFDNLLVRIPNETLIKSQVTNLSRFPIRRSDIYLRVPFDQDLQQIRSLLCGLAERDARVLEEPAPLVAPEGFSESGVELRFSIWMLQVDYWSTHREMVELVQRTFNEAQLRFSVPHRVLVQAAQEGAAGPPT